MDESNTTQFQDLPFQAFYNILYPSLLPTTTLKTSQDGRKCCLCYSLDTVLIISPEGFVCSRLCPQCGSTGNWNGIFKKQALGEYNKFCEGITLRRNPYISHGILVSTHKKIVIKEWAKPLSSLWFSVLPCNLSLSYMPFGAIYPEVLIRTKSMLVLMSLNLQNCEF